jgi:FtsZ-binding cell division protein ZapB
MNSNRGNAEYYAQLENGIAEMEATVERLKMEIHELTEMKDALNQLNSLLKKELKEQIGDLPF